MDRRSHFDRALHGSPLKTADGAQRFTGIMLFILMIGGVGQLTLSRTAFITGFGVYLLGLVVATVVCIPAFWLIWYIDRRERESIWLLFAALIWGAVISTGVSTIFNPLLSGVIDAVLGSSGILGSRPIPWSGWIPLAIVAPLVEETIKGIGVILLFWLMQAEFDNWTDGIVYGGLIGLGFNITEFAFYLIQAFGVTGDIPILPLIAIRLPLFGINHHVIWTALIGGGLGIAMQTSTSWKRHTTMSAGFLLALIGHGLNNSVSISLLGVLPRRWGWYSGLGDQLSAGQQWVLAICVNFLVQGIFYIVLWQLLLHGAKWEIKTFREFLADELNTGTITEAELRSIDQETPFRSRRRNIKAPDKINDKIVNAQNELALRKRHVARKGQNPEEDELVQSWRDDIAKLRRKDNWI